MIEWIRKHFRRRPFVGRFTSSPASRESVRIAARNAMGLEVFYADVSLEQAVTLAQKLLHDVGHAKRGTRVQVRPLDPAAGVPHEHGPFVGKPLCPSCHGVVVDRKAYCWQCDQCDECRGGAR